MLTKIYGSRQYLLIDLKKCGYVHSNAQIPPKNLKNSLKGTYQRYRIRILDLDSLARPLLRPQNDQNCGSYSFSA